MADTSTASATASAAASPSPMPPKTINGLLATSPDARHWFPLEAKALIQPLGSENNWSEVGDGRCELEGLTLRVVFTSYEKKRSETSQSQASSGQMSGLNGTLGSTKNDILTNSEGGGSSVGGGGGGKGPVGDDEDGVDLDAEVEEVRSILIEDILTEDTPLVGDNMCIVWNSIEQHLSLCIMFSTEEAFAVTWAAIHAAQRQQIPPIRQHCEAIFGQQLPANTSVAGGTDTSVVSAADDAALKKAIRTVFVEHLFADQDVKFLSMQKEARRRKDGKNMMPLEAGGDDDNNDDNGGNNSPCQNSMSRAASNANKMVDGKEKEKDDHADDDDENDKKNSSSSPPPKPIILLHQKKALQQIERYALSASIIEADLLNRFPKLFFTMPIVGEEATEEERRKRHDENNNGVGDDAPLFTHPHPRIAVGLLLLANGELLDYIVNTGLPPAEGEEGENGGANKPTAATATANAKDNFDEAAQLDAKFWANPLVLLSQDPRQVYHCPYERWIRTLDHVYGNDDALVSAEIFGKDPRDNFSPKLKKQNSSSSSSPPSNNNSNNNAKKNAPSSSSFISPTSPPAALMLSPSFSSAADYPLNTPIWHPPHALSRLPMPIALQKAMNASIRLNFLRNEVLPHGGFDVSRVIEIKNAAAAATTSSSGSSAFDSATSCSSSTSEDNNNKNTNNSAISSRASSLGPHSSVSDATTTAASSTSTTMKQKDVKRPSPMSPTTLSVVKEGGASTATILVNGGGVTTSSSGGGDGGSAAAASIEALLEAHRSLPIAIDEDIFGIIDQLHHRLLNEVLCSLLVDDEKKLLPQAVVQLLVLPNGKRLSPAEMPAKVVEALEYLRRQSNAENGGGGEEEETDEKDNSLTELHKKKNAEEDNKTAKNEKATTEATTTAASTLKYPTLDDFLGDLIRGFDEEDTTNPSKPPSHSSSSIYQSSVVKDPQHHIKEHLKFFASMLSLAITAFTKDLLPAVVAKLFAPGLLPALSFVAKHYVSCGGGSGENEEGKNALATSSSSLTGKDNNKNNNKKDHHHNDDDNKDLSYSSAIDKELLALLQIAIVKLNEKAEEAVLNELVRNPITSDPEAHIALLRYFVRAALRTNAADNADNAATHTTRTSGAVVVDASATATTAKSGTAAGSSSNSNDANKKKSSAAAAAASTIPPINIHFTPIGTNNMLLFHLLGLHDDEGLACERFADPLLNQQRDAFHQFLISKVMSAELHRMRFVQKEAFDSYNKYHNQQSSSSSSNVFLPAETKLAAVARRRIAAGISNSTASSSALSPSLPLPEVTISRLYHLQALTRAMNETILRVCEYMLALCSNENRELLCAEVILNNDSVVLPWVDAVAEAATIKHRMAVVAKARSPLTPSSSPASLLVEVSIATPSDLLTGAVRFIRSIFNMCAPWFSPTGKSTHVAALFSSPPSGPSHHHDDDDNDTSNAHDQNAMAMLATIKGGADGSAGSPQSTLDMAVMLPDGNLSDGGTPSPQRKIDGEIGGGDQQNTSVSSLASSEGGFGSPIMKRQETEDFTTPKRDDHCENSNSSSGGGDNNNAKSSSSSSTAPPPPNNNRQPPQRPLTAPLQLAKEWAPVITFRLLLSWQQNNLNCLLGAIMAGGGGGEGNPHPSSRSSGGSGGNSAASKEQQRTAELFASQSKTILHNYLLFYNLHGGPRKNGLFHSTLRSLLQMLESDLNPLDLPMKGIGSFQKYNLEDRKDYFVGNFVKMEKKQKREDKKQKKRKEGNGDVGKSKDSSSSSSSDEDDEETISLDEAVMKLKYLILGRLNLLSAARQSLLTTHRAILPTEFVNTWDEVALKTAEMAVTQTLLAVAQQSKQQQQQQATATSSATIVADVCRTLHLPSAPAADAVGGADGGPIPSATGPILSSPSHRPSLTGSRSGEGGGGATADNSLLTLPNASSTNNARRHSNNNSIGLDGHRSPTPKDKAADVSPYRRSPHHSYHSATSTPPRGTPPRMVDELSLFHPPMEGGGVGCSTTTNASTTTTTIVGVGMVVTGSGSGVSVTSGGSSSNNGGTAAVPPSSSSSNGGGGASSAFPRRLRDMMNKISPNTSPSRVSPYTNANNAGAATTTSTGASSSSSPSRSTPIPPASAKQQQQGGNSNSAAPSPPSSHPPSPSSISVNGVGVGAVVSNSSGRVSPKMPSKPVAEPPMRRRHQRQDGTAESVPTETRSDARVNSTPTTASGAGGVVASSNTTPSSSSATLSSDAGSPKNLLSTVMMRGGGDEDAVVLGVKDDDDDDEPMPAKPLAPPVATDSNPASPSPSVSPASVMSGRVLPTLKGEGHDDLLVLGVGNSNKNSGPAATTQHQPNPPANPKPSPSPSNNQHTPTPPPSAAAAAAAAASAGATPSGVNVKRRPSAPADRPPSTASDGASGSGSSRFRVRPPVGGSSGSASNNNSPRTAPSSAHQQRGASEPVNIGSTNKNSAPMLGNFASPTTSSSSKRSASAGPAPTTTTSSNGHHHQPTSPSAGGSTSASAASKPLSPRVAKTATAATASSSSSSAARTASPSTNKNVPPGRK